MCIYIYIYIYIYKWDEPDMWSTVWEIRTDLIATFSYIPQQMDAPGLGDQKELNQLCVDIGRSLEVLPGLMKNRDGWRERERERVRESGNFVLSIWLHDIYFANGSGDWDSVPGRVIQKTQNMVLYTYLLNTQHYKVGIKGKVGAI